MQKTVPWGSSALRIRRECPRSSDYLSDSQRPMLFDCWWNQNHQILQRWHSHALEHAPRDVLRLFGQINDYDERFQAFGPNANEHKIQGKETCPLSIRSLP